jgi:hypothetical protein
VRVNYRSVQVKVPAAGERHGSAHF